VKVWSCFATVGDHIPYERRLMKTVGSLVAYLQGYGELLVRTNGWDPQVLERFRAAPVVSTFAGGIDVHATTEQLEAIGKLLPDEWLALAAMGTPDECVDAVLGQLALGCDGVILHGATPEELEPIVEAGALRRSD
jgi:alkanesulfonate monooxygenase SsuD/methylene tetrahydromethanopterin reductase-like flavin-dependent oxidoreductase (luciferase family)